MARVQGFLASIDYKDGTFVKQGTTLFTIEPETYKLKLEQAQAAEAGAQSSVKQAEADFNRQKELVAKQAVSQATLDTSTSTRDNAQASLQQAQASTRIAEVNYGYTKVAAPFDGVATAHLVSVGELVGVTSPTQLATIVALDPIYVNFNVNEQDVLKVRAEARRRGMSAADLTRLPVQVGLQTEDGYPHQGNLDYASPTINASTGTLVVRGVIPNPDRVLLPGFFVRVRVPVEQEQNAALVPDTAQGSDQGGRYVLVVNKDNVVEQRRVRPGQLEGTLRVIEEGLKADDRVVIGGLLRAIPGQKVDPQTETIEPPKADIPAILEVGSAYDLQILHRAAGPLQRHRHPDDPDRRRGAVQSRHRAISRRCAADGAGHHTLSRRQRQDRDRYRGAADRAAGQRRRGHDLHAVL